MKQIQTKLIILILVGLFAMPVMAKSTKMVPSSFSELAKQAKPAVVNIQTVKTIKGGGRVFRHFFGQPFGNRDRFEDFFAPFLDQQPRNRKEQSLGSGFIISKDGYIVTNNHVIKDADKIKVILHNDKEYDGKIIGTDPMTDLALIKIKAKNLTPLELGNSKDLEVGSWVVAIGSPFGLEQTVTAGIISAKERVIGFGPYDNFLQTDASINPGNSGGPLLNLDGEVVGINTAISASGQGIGFAIPSDMAKGIIDQLIESKHVSRGWLGVAIQNVTKELAEYYGIKETKGVYVAKVYEGDPAHKAGIKPGDVITMINDKAIETSRDLTLAISSMGVGEKIKVRFIREGDEKAIDLKLAQRPDEDPETRLSLEGYDVFGFKFQEMTPDIAKRFNYPPNIKGLIISQIEPKSKASETGVRHGDVLLEVNRHKISSLKDYTTVLSKIKTGQAAQLLFRRGNSHVFVVSFVKQ
ncbi:MAG: DegQ family serine endoprotease [Desulfobacteraceae bacterium]|nr:DegQ family serine endoprotease [Desulfobacteraceae bacterium]